MHLQQLSLIQFKNYAEVQIELSSKINCFTGNNGVGKTNLLDAVYYLCMCKSAFGTSDTLNIQHNTDFFVIQGRFERLDKTEHIYCGIKRGQTKIYKRNNKAYNKLSEHIGLLPVVIISPADSNLIIGGSEDRRKFMDEVISQYDHSYLEALIRYNKTLAQRNKLLKDFAAHQTFNIDLLDAVDIQLIRSGDQIYTKRSNFVEKMVPVFQRYYQFISNNLENVSLTYKSQLYNNSFGTLLLQHRDKDRILQYTTVGIHRDDLLLAMNEYPMKQIASQGQQKTYLIALQFAKFEFIKHAIRLTPLLLLDDIFDKLDHTRVKKIVELVSLPDFGQIFITDTHKEQMQAMLQTINIAHSLFYIDELGIKKC